MKAKMSNTTENMLALAHMVGAFQDVFGGMVTTSQIAAYMGVSKPTALARLKEYAVLGIVKYVAYEHRPNVLAFKWGLTDSATKRFYSNYYLPHYRQWRSKSEHVQSIRNKTVKSMFI